MTRLPAHLSDRTALLGSSAATLAGLPPYIIICYISARLILPVVLIVYAAHGATPTQRIALVRDYLLYQPTTPDRPTRTTKKSRKRCTPR